MTKHKNKNIQRWWHEMYGGDFMRSRHLLKREEKTSTKGFSRAISKDAVNIVLKIIILGETKKKKGRKKKIVPKSETLVVVMAQL